MNAWIDELRSVTASGEDACLVTIAMTRGSAPREVGAKMLVTSDRTFATVGGGELEYQCARIACQILAEPESVESRLRKFTLGANCGQCCGGVVEVMFERIAASRSSWVSKLSDLYATRTAAAVVTEIGSAGKAVITQQHVVEDPAGTATDESIVETARSILLDGSGACLNTVDDGNGRKRRIMIEPVACSDFNIAVFGAGHVGTATIAALSRLDCNVRWIDNRRGIFPGLALPKVAFLESEQPGLEVGAMPAGSHFLVMTHSHALDFEICDRILRREDFAYCGLIGSLSKRRRFERMMRQQGLSESLLDRLTCPIGISGIAGKSPQDIAVAVSAQLLRIRSEAALEQARADENVVYV